jgi:hypothetical protein
MAARYRFPWIPRFLFVLSVLTSLALFMMVFAAPALDNGEPTPKGAARLPALFARDKLVRRTATGGAIGLLATACIFFRTAGGRRYYIGRGRPPRVPPSDIAGA